MADTLTIAARFNGPPGSANGGYTCGLLARRIDGPAEVTLRVPPPLEREMTVVREGDRVTLLDGDVVVAEARPTTVELDVPAPVALADAEAAAARYPWRDEHPYPTCFVCGPRRPADDGLRIYPGPAEGSTLFAAPWTPDRELAGDDGLVRPEYVWGALDCPSGIVTSRLPDLSPVILLGRLAVDLIAPVRAGEPHVVEAWTFPRDGRKLPTASALFTAGGELRAVARATWIEVREAG